MEKKSREPDSNQWPRDASYDFHYSLPLYQLSYHGIWQYWLYTVYITQTLANR